MPNGLPEVSGRFITKASNGVLHGETGVQGNPGSTTYNGTIEPDGTVTIRVSGLSGDTKTDPYHRPAGSKTGFTMIGTIEGTSGVAARTDRECDIKLAKQFVPAPAPAASASQKK
jgi:hypothetical protein